MNKTEKDKPTPLWYEEQNFRDFKQKYDSEKASVLLFVGSGVSIGAGFPNWRDLLLRLRKEAEKDSVEVDSRFDAKLGAGKYYEAGSILKDAFGSRQKNEWPDLLKRIFLDPKCTKTIPGEVITLCKLKWHNIVTTNYDQIIEVAYEQTHDKKLKVYHPWNGHIGDSVREKEQYIFKIHGDINDASSKIVLTTEEYKELYKKRGGKSFRDVLGKLLSQAHATLFLGFSYEDKYFTELSKSIYFGTDTPTRAFALFPQPPEKGRMASLVQQTGIRPIYYRCRDNTHAEFNEFINYLHTPELYDARYSASRLKKKATVVLLHTGGTIGSIRSEHDKGDELDLHKIGSRFDRRLKRISDILQQRYRRFSNTGGEFQFELKWEILSPDQQLLSENATVAHWNNLVNQIQETIYKYSTGPKVIASSDKIEDPFLKVIYERERKEYEIAHNQDSLTVNEFLEDISDRYIAGIVVLHGTDTLASAATALAVGLKNLPFPIVVTGANRPPEEESLKERVAILSKSDAWKNLVTSLYFLQCFGHRFTETFVCFGDTIHHGLNLRKTTIEAAPLKRVGISHQDVEPFIFRNASISKQYIFRLIDGLFCNNFYPIGEVPYTELIGSEFDRLRHVRQNPFRRESGETLGTFSFGSTVFYMAVSPSFPYVDVKLLLKKSPQLRAVLVEGYKSGTYPTIAGNWFTKLISDLYDHGIPVILVSQYGIKPKQELYETFRINGREIPVLRLPVMIPETALPVLCRVVSSISKADWKGGVPAGAAARTRVQSRIDLIGQGVQKLFTNSNNIVSLEFGDIFDETAGQVITKNALGGDERQPRRDPSSSIDLAASGANRMLKFRGKSTSVVMPRADFLWNMSEIIRPVEKVGSGPDGFAILADMGFEWGFEEFHQLWRSRASAPGRKSFGEYKAAEQTKLVSAATKMLRLALQALEMRGIAFFDGHEDTEIHIDPNRRDGVNPPASFSFKVSIKRKDEEIRGDEKYTVQSYSQEEADFFRELNDGPARRNNNGGPLEPNVSGELDQHHLEALADQYERLMESSWKFQMNSFDWYLLGVFKGFTCAIAWYLLFDQLAENHAIVMDGGYDRAMRQSVRCNILQSDESFFVFEMTYYGWYE